MGLLKKVFGKQYCSLCGEDASFFTRTKISDGVLCSKCKAKLSPHYKQLRSRTVAQVRMHIAYRTHNRELHNRFHASRVLMTDQDNLYLDDENQLFCVARQMPSKESNPDLFSFRCIRDCNVDVSETERELTRYDAEKQCTVSYNPPRYEYRRSIRLIIDLDGHEWLTRLCADCGDFTFQNRAPVTFDHALKKAETICSELKLAAKKSKTAPKPAQSRICPHCGATTVPDAQGRCEYCMSAING